MIVHINEIYNSKSKTSPIETRDTLISKPNLISVDRIITSNIREKGILTKSDNTN